jgi:hypothetical protein
MGITSWGPFIREVSQYNPRTSTWEDLRYDRDDDPHVINGGEDIAFTYDEEDEAEVTKAEAWRIHLNEIGLAHPIRSRYTAEVDGRDGSVIVQFDDPAYLQGIMTVYNWAGLNWRHDIGPIFENLSHEIEIAPPE